MPENREVIDNPRSDRVRRVNDLADRRQRQRHGRFLIEGPQCAREAVACRPDALMDLYIEVGPGDGLQPVSPAVAAIRDQARSQAPGVYVHYVTSRVMQAISKNAQGIVGVGSLEAMRDDLDALAADWGEGAEAAADDNETLIAALWQVRDPGNAGAVIRAADAAGCQAALLVDECVDPFNPKVLRATAGSIFHIPVLPVSTDEFFVRCRGWELPVLAADIYGAHGRQPQALPDFLARSPSGAAGRAVLFGNEARGLPEEVLARVDAIVSIPIYGRAESLNLATSAAVMLYALAMSSRLERM
ncbi:rRNA methylase [Bifidobacterium actinocoloniiforme DSM 22766]|uniref:rRNA methylase n=1 Tax=Bifidobacterium actinocoloniiforme DSM 22766 TaxID=1437605 RepID=A0A086Z129_9BIFI|nr:RNA methyltransferase [Bifidobacterium actinocoloniiforme]AKV55404.1 rRNA methyltransferase [Bifidobacterium actinocoloniiforme DSM 22766]KFI40229.1 rRNA methylase [Bifidobacterium actinocoloniiforme DSM 22766]